MRGKKVFSTLGTDHYQQDSTIRSLDVLAIPNLFIVLFYLFIH